MIDTWSQALDIIKNELSPLSFSRWFTAETIISVDKEGDNVVFQISDDVARDFLEDAYSELIYSAFSDVGEIVKDICFITEDNKQEARRHTYTADKTINNQQSQFNPRYTFDSFVVGSSNRFAHAAAMAVAESPAMSYNPLFIYGGSGLGKTHLMQAVAHYTQEKTPHKNVIYVSSEKFTNEFIFYLQNNSTDEFKNKYRNADILLIDDIQFIANKNRIQEEFFHTFNALHDAGKQIVISSDRLPNEMSTLEERLRSRFGWGLITDIQPPDWETRCAILKRKALMENIEVDDNVIYYIAEKIHSNIRELEGALNNIIYFSKLNNEKLITLSLTQEVLKGIISNEQPNLTISAIQNAVANYFGITVEDLKSKKKDRGVSHPRQIAMYMCRNLINATQPQIGRDFGGRDHSTVIHACMKIDENRKTDKQLNHSIQEIENILHGR